MDSPKRDYSQMPPFRTIAVSRRMLADRRAVKARIGR